jgi:DNA polymerase-3 subunit epsilon
MGRGRPLADYSIPFQGLCYSWIAMDKAFLFLDCQTTGMRPANGHLLEVAWGMAGEPAESYLVKLPEGGFIPNAVKEITGIRAKDMEGAVEFEAVREKLKAFLTARPGLEYALVHYAQFEKPWMEHLFGGEFPLRFLCTQKIASRVFPNSPSRSIRGVLGYLGKDPRPVKRAAEHLEATKEIWWAVAARLEGKSPEELEAWLNEKPAKKAESRIQYRLEREKRLSLPDAPGIYRMLSQSGKVLYVGKATSLKDRVNSYFRGKKGRDRKKLEMLAHVWDIETMECGSPLERLCSKPMRSSGSIRLIIFFSEPKSARWFFISTIFPRPIANRAWPVY